MVGPHPTAGWQTVQCESLRLTRVRGGGRENNDCLAVTGAVGVEERRFPVDDRQDIRIQVRRRTQFSCRCIARCL